MPLRAILLLILVAGALGGCGDDPTAPGPGKKGGDNSPPAADTEPQEPPRLDALRNGAGWRVTLNPPRRLPPGFKPVLALLEGADGSELARSTRVEGPIGFAIDQGGRIRGVLVDAGGRRLEVELELP